MTRAAVLTGLGTALPPGRVTNDDLAERLDTSDQWIRSRTGIAQRYWSTDQSTGDLAAEAGAAALNSAGSPPVDLVLVATTTPDHPCPATAPEVAARLGLGIVPAFDVAAVCTGFVYALATASAHIEAGMAHHVLVIGADTYSTILDPDDRGTTVIFGDGAGAVVLSDGENTDPGALLGFELGSDGTHRELITIPGGGSRARTSQGTHSDSPYFTMQGKAVFDHAVTRMGESTRAVLARVGWSADTVERLVGHQANVRILESLARHLGVGRDRLVIDVDRVGNTSAASIPLALARAVGDGALVAGQRTVFTAFGGGLTWGSTALIWPDVKPNHAEENS
ncbi:beta-ketoacyl-ACP synthase III [Nocardia sp. NPDC052566]|uniref:beta-ketoacyl-ACP synthase III n=1 Tax=Nocardia sp. NPDC052566 TaxID=3364330 RepID=UPI0037C95B10